MAIPQRARLGLVLAVLGSSAWLVLAAVGPDAPRAARPDGGETRAMAERLARLAQQADPREDLYVNARRVAMRRADLANAELSPAERFEARRELGVELMLAGDAQAAVDELSALLADYDANPDAYPSRQRAAVLEQLAVGWLRLGEQENCIEHHGTASCLAPIRGDGIHAQQRGSRQAIACLLEFLERRPDHLGAVWLLNLATMTLGEWPDGVPEAFRIPADAFDSEDDIGRFPDVANESGVDVRGHAGGACLEDFDRDGDLDLMVSSWGHADPLRYFVNRGDGHFDDRTHEAGLDGLTGGLNLVHADYDDDGWPDVLVLRGAWLSEQGRLPNSLVRNLGGGRFADVTVEAGLLSFHPTQTAAWGDYDGDGWLDLFVGNESTQANIHPCELWHNQGDGTFVDVAAATGTDIIAFVKGAVFGDVDGDGLPELYVSILNGPNRLLHNDGPVDGVPPLLTTVPTVSGDSAVLERAAAAPARAWRFTDVARSAGVDRPVTSFPTWFFDYDSDGDLDLWVSGYWGSTRHVFRDYMGLPHRGATPRLYRNRGDGHFDDVTEESGLDLLLLTMGANFGDLDNDGWLDFYAGTGQPGFTEIYPNRMFRSDGGAGGGPIRFLDVTTSGGFGHLQKGHAITFGDVDGDGDQDVYAVMGGAFEGDVFQNALFRNPGHGHHWITLRLEGVRANRSAIGARIRVSLTGADGAPRDVHAFVGTGGSFGSESLQAEIGLGAARTIREVQITWPGGGHVQRVGPLAVDRVYAIREGDAAVELPR